MRRQERAEVQAAADVLRGVVEQVEAGDLDASPTMLARLEGALLALDGLAGGVDLR